MPRKASGTGNMEIYAEWRINTRGTMDGANVEIAELAGAENIYTFGKDSESIIKLYGNSGLCFKRIL